MFVDGLRNLRNVFRSSIGVRLSRNTKAFRYPIKSSHTETTLWHLEARESGLLYLSNSLKAFGLSAEVMQRHYEEEYHPLEISSLPDCFDVVETHSIEAYSCDCIP